MLRWVCSVIDLRRRQNVVRTSVTHSAIASCAAFLFLPHFDVICDLLLNRRTATWNLFVKLYLRSRAVMFVTGNNSENVFRKFNAIILPNLERLPLVNKNRNSNGTAHSTRKFPKMMQILRRIPLFRFRPK